MPGSATSFGRTYRRPGETWVRILVLDRAGGSPPHDASIRSKSVRQGGPSPANSAARDSVRAASGPVRDGPATDGPPRAALWGGARDQLADRVRGLRDYWYDSSGRIIVCDVRAGATAASDRGFAPAPRPRVDGQPQPRGTTPRPARRELHAIPQHAYSPEPAAAATRRPGSLRAPHGRGLIAGGADRGSTRIVRCADGRGTHASDSGDGPHARALVGATCPRPWRDAASCESEATKSQAGSERTRKSLKSNPGETTQLTRLSTVAAALARCQVFAGATACGDCPAPAPRVTCSG